MAGGPLHLTTGTAQQNHTRVLKIKNKKVYSSNPSWTPTKLYFQVAGSTGVYILLQMPLMDLGVSCCGFACVLYSWLGGAWKFSLFTRLGFAWQLMETGLIRKFLISEAHTSSKTATIFLKPWYVCYNGWISPWAKNSCNRTTSGCVF